MEFTHITVSKPTGKTLTDNEGFEYEEQAVIDGYHLNCLNPNEDERALIEPYIIEVNTPSAVYAGRKDTICLKFANREDWLALNIEQVEEV